MQGQEEKLAWIVSGQEGPGVGCGPDDEALTHARGLRGPVPGLGAQEPGSYLLQGDTGTEQPAVPKGKGSLVVFPDEQGHCSKKMSGVRLGVLVRTLTFEMNQGGIGKIIIDPT